MPVITVSRQMGALGSEIAYQVSEQMGCRLIWRELINQAARRAGAPDAALAAIDELGLLGITPSRQASAAYRLAVDQIMQELLQEDNMVILGRAGQVILRDQPNVLHVRIIAPLELRVQRIAERRSVDLAAARAQVEASDRYRENFMRRFYHVRWDDPALYHLTVNTGLLPAWAAIQVIYQAAMQLTLHPETTLPSKAE